MVLYKFHYDGYAAYRNALHYRCSLLLHMSSGLSVHLLVMEVSPAKR